MAATAGATVVASIVFAWHWHLRKATKQVTAAATASQEKNKSEDDSSPVREIQMQEEKKDSAAKRRILQRGSITVVHGSMTGTTRAFANDLYSSLSRARNDVQIGATEEWDWWDELLNDDDDSNSDRKKATLILFLPTHTNGTWPPCASALQEALAELQNDWRIAKFPLKRILQVAVFGMGSSEYGATMGQPAKEAVKMFQKLGAKVLVTLQVGDDAVGTHAQETFEAWKEQAWNKLGVIDREKESSPCGCSSGTKEKQICCKIESNGAEETEGNLNGGCCNTPHTHAKEESYDDYEDDDDDDDVSVEDGEPEVMDLEDLGDAVAASRRSTTSHVKWSHLPKPKLFKRKATN
jgi:sulfite reductase alpha subunit-like flavoprotein